MPRERVIPNLVHCMFPCVGEEGRRGFGKLGTGCAMVSAL